MSTFIPRLARCFSASAIEQTRFCYGLMYKEFGNPADVVSLQQVAVNDLQNDEVEIEMMVAPVNPADINQVQGTYPLKPKLPAVGGNEGVGRVIKRGNNVTMFQEGDWVIPCNAGIGTWRTHVVDSASKFISVTQDISVNFAATLQVNPPTAYRMLKDFIHLQPGDCIIQNGANSAVGQCVIQLAAVWGVNTINIIRNRPQEHLDELITYLKGLGATEVITEEYLASHEMKELIKRYTCPQLGLNCVGGKSTTNLLRQLSHGGILVTYGGMSKRPVAVPTSAFIFKDIHCVGYWNSAWLEKNINNRKVIQEMFDDLSELGRKGKLQIPRSVEHPLKDYQKALSSAMKPFNSTKQLLNLQDMS